MIGSLASPPMTNSEFTTEDICDFAASLGFRGIDIDLFYEAYYDLNGDSYEEELEDDVKQCYTGS